MFPKEKSTIFFQNFKERAAQVLIEMIREKQTGHKYGLQIRIRF